MSESVRLVATRKPNKSCTSSNVQKKLDTFVLTIFDVVAHGVASQVVLVSWPEGLVTMFGEIQTRQITYEHKDLKSK